jgi:predicted RNase H-like nuclease (RuvC/YqgF family)
MLAEPHQNDAPVTEENEYSAHAEAHRRLELAFEALEQRIGELQQQAEGTPDIDVLEQENKQLHQALVNEQTQNNHLKEMVRALQQQLQEATERVEALNGRLTKPEAA